MMSRRSLLPRWGWAVGSLLLLGLLVGGIIQFCSHPSGLPPASLTRIPGIEHAVGSAAWLDGWIVVHVLDIREDDIYDSRIWKLRPDGSAAEMLPLPNSHDCEDHRYGFGYPVRLPDGRMAYMLLCAPNRHELYTLSQYYDLAHSRLYMLAYDLETGAVEVLRTTEMPFLHVGTGEYSWNPEMTRGVSSTGTRLVGETLFWFTRDDWGRLDVGLPNAAMARWSPDGDQIAFVGATEQGLMGPAQLDSVFNLYLMDPDGTNIRPLGEGFRYPSGIAWSPDGAWLAVGGEFGWGFTADEKLWLVNATTGERHLIARGDLGGPAWSPDGQRILAYEDVAPFPDLRTRVVILEGGVLDLVQAADAPTIEVDAEASPAAVPPTPTLVPPTPTPDSPTLVTLPPTDPAHLDEPIHVNGTAASVPLVSHIAEVFKDAGGPRTEVNGGGPRAALVNFCQFTDFEFLATAHPLAQDDVALCRAHGRDPLAFRIGTDAQAVVVHPDNEFVTDVTLTEAVALFSSAERWRDVRATWPDEPIQRYTPGPDHWAYRSFVEVVFGEEGRHAPKSASNLRVSDHPDPLLHAVANDPYAIGYVSYAAYAEQPEGVRVLSIEGVAPTMETVEAGTYPLARPLVLYSTAELITEQPRVAGFLNYALTHAPALAAELGYVPLSEGLLNESRQTWLDTMTP